MLKIRRATVRLPSSRNGKPEETQMTSFQQTPLALKPEIWDKLRQGINVSAVSDIMHGRGLHNQVMRHDIQALDSSTSI